MLEKEYTSDAGLVLGLGLVAVGHTWRVKP